MKRRFWLGWGVLAAGVLGCWTESSAQVPPSYSYVISEPGAFGAPTPVPSRAGLAYIPRPTVGTTYIPPYSYQVVANPYASRHYAGYGTNDFPFYGRPYGRPYDAWTWNYLSHDYYNAMAHYYYEPVRPTVAPGFKVKPAGLAPTQ